MESATPMVGRCRPTLAQMCSIMLSAGRGRARMLVSCPATLIVAVLPGAGSPPSLVYVCFVLGREAAALAS